MKLHVKSAIASALLLAGMVSGINLLGASSSSTEKLKKAQELESYAKMVPSWEKPGAIPLSHENLVDVIKAHVPTGVQQEISSFLVGDKLAYCREIVTADVSPELQKQALDAAKDTLKPVFTQYVDKSPNASKPALIIAPWNGTVLLSGESWNGTAFQKGEKRYGHYRKATARYPIDMRNGGYPITKAYYCGDDFIIVEGTRGPGYDFCTILDANTLTAIPLNFEGFTDAYKDLDCFPNMCSANGHILASSKYIIDLKHKKVVPAQKHSGTEIPAYYLPQCGDLLNSTILIANHASPNLIWYDTEKGSIVSSCDVTPESIIKGYVNKDVTKRAGLLIQQPQGWITKENQPPSHFALRLKLDCMLSHERPKRYADLLRLQGAIQQALDRSPHLKMLEEASPHVGRMYRNRLQDVLGITPIIPTRQERMEPYVGERMAKWFNIIYEQRRKIALANIVGSVMYGKFGKTELAKKRGLISVVSHMLYLTWPLIQGDQDRIPDPRMLAFSFYAGLLYCWLTDYRPS
jgi:hypothetical protein